jgi:hypothetical protein
VQMGGRRVAESPSVGPVVAMRMERMECVVEVLEKGRGGGECFGGKGGLPGGGERGGSCKVGVVHDVCG